MHKLKPNLFKWTVVIMTASLFTACTPTPVVQNKEICKQQPQSAECEESSQYRGGSRYVPIGRGGSRSNTDGNNSKTSSRVSSPKSTGTKGSRSFSGKTGFGSFGRGGFGLG